MKDKEDELDNEAHLTLVGYLSRPALEYESPYGLLWKMFGPYHMFLHKYIVYP